MDKKSKKTQTRKVLKFFKLPQTNHEEIKAIYLNLVDQ